MRSRSSAAKQGTHKTKLLFSWADINGNIIPTEYGPYQIDDEILLRSQSLNVTYDFVNTK